MPTIATKHGSIFYNQSGEGPVMVFLHGGGRSSKYFQYELRHYTTFCTVVSFDLPGHGESLGIELPNEKYWELSAEIISEALAKMGIERFFIIGIRDGAIIGLMLANSLKDNVLGLFCDSFEGNEITPERALKIIKHRKRIKRFFLFSLFQQFTMGNDWEKSIQMDNNRLLWFARNRKQFFSFPVTTPSPIYFTCSVLDEEIPDIAQKMNNMKSIVPTARVIFFEGGKHPSFLSNNHEYRKMIQNFLSNQHV